MRKWAAFTVIGLLGIVMPAARAGILLLMDGRSIDGNVQILPLGEGKVSVQPVGKGVMNVGFAEVKEALLNPRAGSEMPSTECDGVQWSRTEVGNSQKAGLAEISGAKIMIKDSSEGFRIAARNNRRDPSALAPANFCFVFQKLEGNGEIVAKVTPSAEGPKTTRAGLMICEGLDGLGPMVLVSRTPDPTGATMLSRQARTESMTAAGDSRSVPVVPSWLKLTRRINPVHNEPEIEASESVNGTQWTKVGEIRRLSMDEKAGIYIGVAATGNFREGIANFDGIKLTGKRSCPEIAGVQDARLPVVATTLVDGTVLASAIDKVSDNGEAAIKRPAVLGGDTLTLQPGSVARTQFGPLNRTEVTRLTGASTGVLNHDGDFLEGDLKGFGANGATVSSVAFGLTTMERRNISAVVLAPIDDVKKEAGFFEVHLSDGSMVVAKKLTVEKEQLVMEEPLLGPMKVAIKDVVSLERRGG